MSQEEDDRKTEAGLEGWRQAAPALDGLTPLEQARALLHSLATPLPRPKMPYSILARWKARESADPRLWVGLLRSLPPVERWSYEEAMSATFVASALRQQFPQLDPADPLWAALPPER